MVIYHNSFDCCILLDYIYVNPHKILLEEFLEINNTLNRKKICRSCVLLYKHVIVEVSSVISTQLGYLISEINKKISRIVPEKTSLIGFDQKRKIIEFMNNLETIYPKYSDLISFIRKSYFEEDIDYNSLVNIETRRKKLAEIHGLKNRFNINYFASFFGKFLKYFDSTEDIQNDFLKEEFESKAKEVFRGSRRKRNHYDYIHLYNSFIYSNKYKEFILHFITRDKVMLQSENLFKKNFKILELSDLIYKLKHLIS
ncbi:MAG: hypothetical protein ACTSU7_08200 [Candidatus Heimdallarchaeaceae archaeon]